MSINVVVVIISNDLITISNSIAFSSSNPSIIPPISNIIGLFYLSWQFNVSALFNLLGYQSIMPK